MLIGDATALPSDAFIIIAYALIVNGKSNRYVLGRTNSAEIVEPIGKVEGFAGLRPASKRRSSF